MPTNALSSKFSDSLRQQLFNLPADEEQIAEFRLQVASWGLPELPESFYEFYQFANGSRYENYDYSPFDQGRCLLSLEGIINEKEMWDDLESKDTFVQYEPGTWWNKNWLPFLYIPDWWVGVIDMEGSFGGKAGQILGFDFKAAEGKYIAHESFDKWLETLIALQDAHLLFYELDEDGCSLYPNKKQEKERQEIEKSINGNFPFFADIWAYRRKTETPNPYWEELEKALAKKAIKKVQKLIKEEKIKLNEQNPYQVENFSVLLAALHHKAFDIAYWLLEQGADILQKDCYGFDAYGKIVYGDYLSNEYDAPGTCTPHYIKLLRFILATGYKPTDYNESEHFLAPLLKSAQQLNDKAMIAFCEQYIGGKG